MKLTFNDIRYLCFTANGNTDGVTEIHAIRGEDVDVYKVCVTCPGDFTALRLTDEARGAGSPTWSPDGNWVAYWNGIGESLIMVKADRSDTTYLASGVFGPPIWKP